MKRSLIPDGPYRVQPAMGGGQSFELKHSRATIKSLGWKTVELLGTLLDAGGFLVLGLSGAGLGLLASEALEGWSVLMALGLAGVGARVGWEWEWPGRLAWLASMRGSAARSRATLKLRNEAIEADAFSGLARVCLDPTQTTATIHLSEPDTLHVLLVDRGGEALSLVAELDPHASNAERARFDRVRERAGPPVAYAAHRRSFPYETLSNLVMQLETAGCLSCLRKVEMQADAEGPALVRVRVAPPVGDDESRRSDRFGGRAARMTGRGEGLLAGVAA